MTGIVAVTHTALEHIRYGLETAVRVIRESGYIISGIITTEKIEHQKRIETFLKSLRQEPRKAHSGTITGGLPLMHALDTA
jgi:hypothetical protein